MLLKWLQNAVQSLGSTDAPPTESVPRPQGSHATCVDRLPAAHVKHACLRAGWVSVLLLESLRNAVQPPGSNGLACCAVAAVRLLARPTAQLVHPAAPAAGPNVPAPEPSGLTSCH